MSIPTAYFYNTDTGLLTLITYAVAINITANVKATIICPASVSVSNLYHRAFRNFIRGILAATTNVTLKSRKPPYTKGYC